MTYANVVSTLALVVAMGTGGAYAATELGRNSVGPKQIKRNAVKSRAIASNAVSAKDLSGGVRSKLRVFYAEIGPDGTAQPGTSSGVSVTPNPTAGLYNVNVGDVKGCGVAATLKSNAAAANGGKSAQIYGTDDGGALVGAIDAAGNPTPAGLAVVITC